MARNKFGTAQEVQNPSQNRKVKKMNKFTGKEGEFKKRKKSVPRPSSRGGIKGNRSREGGWKRSEKQRAGEIKMFNCAKSIQPGNSANSEGKPYLQGRCSSKDHSGR